MAVDEPVTQDNTKGTFLQNVIIWLKFLFAGIKLKTEAKQLVLLVNKLRVDRSFTENISALDDLTPEIKSILASVMKCSVSRVDYIIDACTRAGNKLYPEEAYDFFANWINYRIINIGLDFHYYRTNSILFKMASVALIDIAKDKGITLKEYEADFIINAAYSLERQK